MSVQLALTAVGTYVGSLFGAPQLGAFLGSLVGAAVTPREKIQGPKLDDLSAPRLQYGQAIPRIYGTVRVSGTPIWCSDLQPYESTEGGKGGGPEVTTTAYKVDILFLVSIDSPIVGISRIWVNKKLRYSVGPDTEASDRQASENTTAWADIDVMDGNASQTPWAEYEAAVGVGNAPAMRHRSTIGIAQLDCGNSGQVPLVEFEVFTAGTPTVRGYYDEFADGLADYTGDLSFFTEGAHQYGGCIQVLAHGSIGGGNKFINRSITATTSLGMRVKFHMSAQSTEDAGILALRKPDNSAAFVVIPRREAAIDPSQLCHVRVNGNDIPLGTVALDMLVWYEVQIDLIHGSGNSVVRLYNLETGALIDTEAVPGSHTSYVVDDIEFSSETGVTGDTLFSQLQLIGTPASIDPVDLRDIVETEGARVGLDTTKLDASVLDGIEVAGYATTVSARQTFEDLARIYYFEAFCDDKLRIVRRGGASAETLTHAETGAGVDQAAEPFNGMDRADALALPAFISLLHPDPTRDYEDGSVMSDRLITPSNDTSQVSTRVVLTPSQAKGRADTYARDAWAASQTWGTQVGIAHIARTPTDVFTLTDDEGTTYRSRILRATLADFVFAFEGVLDDVNALADTGIAPPDGDPSVGVEAPGITVLELIDGPILRDEDDEAGLYGAVRINGDGTGSRVFKSIDGTTFTTVADVLSEAVMGVASTALGNVSNPYVWDEANTVTVSVSGTLSSSTRDAMQADGTINLFALKSGDGWEYFRARSCALLSPNVYLLSGLMRGLRGTESFIAGHVVGDKLVALGTAGMLRIPGNASEIGLERFYRGVTLGSSSQASIPFTNEAVGLKPFSPSRLRAERDTSGNITLTWSRRTRLAVRYVGSGGILAPLGEDSESYQVDIYDGSDVVRTLTATSESATYSAANQTTDFGGNVAAGDLDAEVFQVSAVVGRGYGHRKTTL